MSDLIKREDAIKAIEELPNAYNGWSDAYDKAYIIGTLEEVPSADRPQGEWIPSDTDGFVCSVCKNGYRNQPTLMGRPNVASFLYSRVARIAREMGYKEIITYILQSELGTSLKASGWELDKNDCGGGTWSSPSRPRELVQITLFGTEQKYPTERKQRWVKHL